MQQTGLLVLEIVETAANYVHIFCSCSRLKPFWEESFKTLDDVFGIDSPGDSIGLGKTYEYEQK